MHTNLLSPQYLSPSRLQSLHLSLGSPKCAQKYQIRAVLNLNMAYNYKKNERAILRQVQETMRIQPWGSVAHPWTQQYIHTHIGLRCIIAMAIINMISLYLLLILSPHEQAYLFFVVHVVILIYLDITWIATGLINPGIINSSGDDEYMCPMCEDPKTIPENFANVGHCMEC